MSRETVEAKAIRYLAEGRITVRAVSPDVVEADARGNGDAVYTVERAGRRWSCSCAAWQRQCCHVRAVRLVT